MARVAGEVASSSMSKAGDAIRYSDEEKHTAVVDAFKRIAAEFTWEEKGGRWISKKAGEESDGGSEGGKA